MLKILNGIFFISLNSTKATTIYSIALAINSLNAGLEYVS
jgi:hypothetical protein